MPIKILAEPFSSKTLLDPTKKIFVDGRQVFKKERFDDPANPRWRLYPLPDTTSVLPQPIYLAFRDQTIIACDKDDPQSFVLLDSFSTRHFIKVIP